MICVAGMFAINFYSCGNQSDEKLADSTGMPGDNFSLAGALNLLKESKNLADFERKLNTKKTGINNLDLDGDGKTDYIRVKDQMAKNSHAIVLQVAVVKKEIKEMQDVALISIEKTGDKKAFVQIKGNEMLYGDSAVFAPSEENKVAQASMIPVAAVVGVEVNVWAWPVIPVLFSPAYVVYESPVVLNIYPEWYEPWPPYPYGWYRREIAHQHRKKYAPVYVLTPTPAVVFYGPRVYNSVYVVNRYQGIYVKNGWPKKGRAYYTPSGPVMVNPRVYEPGGGRMRIDRPGGPAPMPGGGPHYRESHPQNHGGAPGNYKSPGGGKPGGMQGGGGPKGGGHGGGGHQGGHQGGGHGGGHGKK